MRFARVVALVMLVSTAATAETFDLSGFLIARGQYVSGLPSWMRGGLGRFDGAGSSPDRGQGVALGDVQLGVDWQPVQHVLVHAHGLARPEPSENHGKRSRLVSTYSIR